MLRPPYAALPARRDRSQCICRYNIHWLYFSIISYILVLIANTSTIRHNILLQCVVRIGREILEGYPEIFSKKKRYPPPTISPLLP